MKSDLQYLYISLPYDIMFPVGIFFLNVRSLIHILFSFACTVIIRPAHTNKTKEDMGLLPPPLSSSLVGPHHTAKKIRMMYSQKSNCAASFQFLQIYECNNWEWNRAVLFMGIFFSNFRYSVFAELKSKISFQTPFKKCKKIKLHCERKFH